MNKISQNINEYEPTDIPSTVELICTDCDYATTTLMNECQCGGKFNIAIITETVKLKSKDKIAQLNSPRKNIYDYVCNSL